MKNNIIQNKSYDFAVEVVGVCKSLIHKQKEYVLGKQLLRCGTSIGANIEEALGAQSRKDFMAKISIAYKEARETSYWIRILRDSKTLPDEVAMNLLTKCIELRKILCKIQNSSKILNC